ncbi:putative membrane protein [Clostridioides difficile P6]|nr:putative membrane protein [Clostridioides difficile P6]
MPLVIIPYLIIEFYFLYLFYQPFYLGKVLHHEIVQYIPISLII